MSETEQERSNPRTLKSTKRIAKYQTRIAPIRSRHNMFHVTTKLKIIVVVFHLNRLLREKSIRCQIVDPAGLLTKTEVSLLLMGCIGYIKSLIHQS